MCRAAARVEGDAVVEEEEEGGWEERRRDSTWARVERVIRG